MNEIESMANEPTDDTINPDAILGGDIDDQMTTSL